MNPAGRVMDFNPAAATISGYNREEALGRPVLEVLAGEVDRKICRSGWRCEARKWRPRN